MKEIRLTGKKINLGSSKVVFHYDPKEDWQDYFKVMKGHWKQENGYLIGEEPGNFGGILFTKESYPENKDFMMRFKASTVLPATRDVNAVWNAKWDEKTDYLGLSYVCGLNGWWENKAGIEANGGSEFRAVTNAYYYKPGTEIEMICGSIHGHTFMVVDGLLVMEYIDPTPILGGHFGFSPYCTVLKIRDIDIMEINWEPFYQEYEPEFKELLNK